jgi:hypothetical protein
VPGLGYVLPNNGGFSLSIGGFGEIGMGECFTDGGCPNIAFPSLQSLLPHFPDPQCDFGPCAGSDFSGSGKDPILERDLQRINQQCLDNFNNSAAGKVTNLFSLTSIFIGPERLSSGIELIGGGTAKYLTYRGLNAAASRFAFTPFGVLTGSTAELIHVGARALLPISLGLTGAQLAVHGLCYLASHP